MLNNPLVTRAHFYTLLMGVCALCEADSPDSQMSGLFCVALLRTRECLPCAATAAIPAHFAAETVCWCRPFPPQSLKIPYRIKRNLAKINYRIHTDAIKENLIPSELSARQISLVYANEADVLNMALFGMTAKQWRDSHPDLKGNIRDYANVSQLVCLSNLENLNAVFINEGISQPERLAKLNAIAISQMKVLTEDHRILQLDAADDTGKPE